MVSKKSKETLQRVDGKDNYLGGKFGIWTLLRLWLSAQTMIQSSFNYAYFQGTGYSQAMYPFFKRIYAGNKEKFKEALIDNIEFYNTGPVFGNTVIASLHLLMLQTGSSDQDAKKIKFALMGPLAGIHDSIFNFGTQPLFAGIAAGLSSGGSWSGFWFWILVYWTFNAVVGATLTIVTYKSGQKFMANLSSLMTGIVKMASMVGITIIGVLSLRYTGIALAGSSTSVIVSEGVITTKVTSFQAIADQFAPYLLQVTLVVFMYFMISKYDWSIYKALVFLLLLGITGYVYGIF